MFVLRQSQSHNYNIMYVMIQNKAQIIPELSGKVKKVHVMDLEQGRMIHAAYVLF